MTAQEYFWLSLVCVSLGVVFKMWGRVRRRRSSQAQLVTTTPPNAAFVDHLHGLLAANPDMLPELPNDPLEYEGWFEEAIKQVNLRVARGTRGQHLVLLKQLNEYRMEYLKFVQTTKAMSSEIRLAEAEHEAKLSHLQREIAENKARIRELDNQGQTLPSVAKPRDPVREFSNNLRTKLRTFAEASAERDRFKKEFPEYANEIDREFQKQMADWRERG